ncbi:phosphoesterase RecJ-like protein [Breznakia blatticola]|uniref:Phosphoesterase RecJ-like protein n=1 Tax=Breznakia blatticola TaxID=1754012 RepID=A0A4R7ZTR4_9FIRM|nr:bifunctional oligoribonuclease/PAP phosphatase NrnA [Breznakia blatticola]TDW20321.1 phosphoesterase RecJ-like protein [Breznakia blatticola]
MLDILNEVKDFEIITIYRHTGADADALGSQFGMKYFLESNCPDKKIYALGDDVGSAADMFPTRDQLDDISIAKSCAIILDTGNTERIDDQRYKMAKKVIKIDHHIEVDAYGDVSYVDTKAAAACEILALMFENSKKVVSTACARALYIGLLADSINFTTTSTTARTLQAAAYLVSCGLDVNKISQERMGMSENDFFYINEIRSSVTVDRHVAYAIMDASTYEKYGLDYNLAKEKVFAMANVKEFEIYCLFTEDKSYGEGYYNGSLRSKNVAINEIANDYGGGGHANACGVKKLTKEDISRLVNDLANLL